MGSPQSQKPQLPDRSQDPDADMPKCNYESCRANALRDGDGRCFLHSEVPSVVARRQAARSSGGKSSKVRAPKTIREVQEILGRAMVEGKSPEELSALARIAQTWIAANDKDNEQRI